MMSALWTPVRSRPKIRKGKEKKVCMETVEIPEVANNLLLTFV